MTDLQILCGFAVGMTGMLLVVEAMMLGSPALGWISKPWLSRACMIAVGLLLWARGWTIFHGQPVPPIGLVLSGALLVWRGVELMRVVRISWDNEAARAHRAADVERHKANEVMRGAASLYRMPIWLNGRWRRQPRAD